CQYIDITGLDPGNYTLRMVVNPAGLIAEATTNNNVTLVPVTIPRDCTTPAPNANFSNPTLLRGPPLSTSHSNNCSSKEFGEPNHASNAGGHSVWFTWTPDSNQTAIVTPRRSDFDTLLAVYTGNTLSTLSLVAANDDVSSLIHQSAVSFDASAGTAYR